MKKNSVVFKGGSDGITIIAPREEKFDVIKKELEEKLESAKKFFDGASVNITVRGKKLTEEEEYDIINLISEKTNLNINFFNTDGKKATAKLKPKAEEGSATKFYKGSVRSGQVLKFEGSIVIDGDINPGGEVKAEGNIIVMGRLKGLAHAGCNGYEDAFIMALSMTPVQLRIADKITVFPEDRQLDKKTAEKAYIENGQICVVTLN